jgi:hypothetical protein
MLPMADGSQRVTIIRDFLFCSFLFLADLDGHTAGRARWPACGPPPAQPPSMQRASLITTKATTAPRRPHLTPHPRPETDGHRIYVVTQKPLL